MDGINTELRTSWRANWLGSIEEIADLEVQRAAWLNPDNGNPHYTFVEYVVCYFDGLSVNDHEGGYAARVAEGLLTIDEARVVETFHRGFALYTPPGGDDYNHEATIADEGWHKVVIAAQQARARLDSLITDPAERRTLIEPSVYAQLASKRGAHS